MAELEIYKDPSPMMYCCKCKEDGSFVIILDGRAIRYCQKHLLEVAKNIKNIVASGE